MSNSYEELGEYLETAEEILQTFDKFLNKLDEVSKEILSGDITPDYIMLSLQLEQIYKNKELNGKFENLIKLFRDIEAGKIYPVKKIAINSKNVEK